MDTLSAWRKWRPENTEGFSSRQARRDLLVGNTPIWRNESNSTTLFAAARYLIDFGDGSDISTARAFLHDGSDDYLHERARLLIHARDSFGIELLIRLLERGDGGMSAFAERQLARTAGISSGRLVVAAQPVRVKALGKKWREWWKSHAAGFVFKND